MIKIIDYKTLVLSLTLLHLGAPGSSWAQDFYRGKTIRFIVGQAAGVAGLPGICLLIWRAIKRP
jgi:hypothetical protein